MARKDKDQPASTPRMITTGLWYVEDGFKCIALREHPDKAATWKVSCTQQGGSRHRQPQVVDMTEKEFLKAHALFLARQPNPQPRKFKRSNTLAIILADKKRFAVEKLTAMYQARPPVETRALA